MDGLPARREYDFMDLFVVVCPRCQASAEVRLEANHKCSRRLVCAHCGLIRSVTPRMRGITSRPASENVLNGLSLWFQATTRWGVLYAYNRTHLTYIRDYVAATLRKVDFTNVSYRNGSVASRLPNWVKSAKNRQEILKAIDRMAAK